MIKNIKLLTLAVTLTILLAACSEANRTTEWYVQHMREQAVELEHCKSHPDEAKTPNCIAVHEADLIIQQGHDAIKKYLADHNLKEADL